MDEPRTACLRHAGLESELKAVKERMEYVVQAQEKALEVAKREVDRRLEGMNNFQHRMDRLENTFVTKVELELIKQTQTALHLDHSDFATKDSLQSVQRLIWIGIGVFMAFQLAFNFIVK